MNQEIFAKICDLVIDPEFNEGQVNFFSKHCSKFTDDEENRHDYKDIHEEYITILEQAIEAVLKQSYTEDQINQFYLYFAENYNEFKGTNDDAFAIMNATIDFQAFKKQMLNYKSGIKDQDKSEQVDQNFAA